MADWKFGDVLRLVHHDGHDTRVLFLVRPAPGYVVNPDGSTKFWGFTGLYLQPDCPTDGYPACPNDHFLYHRGGFGGHPAAKHSNWVLEP